MNSSHDPKTESNTDAAVPIPALRDARERILWRILALGFCLIGVHSLFLLFDLFPEAMRRTQLDLHIWCALCLILPFLGYLIRHLSRVGTIIRGRTRIVGLLTGTIAACLALTGIVCLWIPSGAVGNGLALVHAWIGFAVLALFLIHRFAR